MFEPPFSHSLGGLVLLTAAKVIRAELTGCPYAPDCLGASNTVIGVLCFLNVPKRLIHYKPKRDVAFAERRPNLASSPKP